MRTEDGERYQMIVNRATQAAVLHAAGEWEKAEDLFADAEQRQRKLPPNTFALFPTGLSILRPLLRGEGRRGTRSGKSNYL